MSISPATLHLLQQLAGVLQAANFALLFPKNKELAALAGTTVQIFSGYIQELGNATVPPPPAQKV